MIFFKNIFEGRIMGRRPRGRPRANYFHNIKEKMGCISYQRLKGAAKDRHTWLFRLGVAFRVKIMMMIYYQINIHIDINKIILIILV